MNNVHKGTVIYAALQLYFTRPVIPETVKPARPTIEPPDEAFSVNSPVVQDLVRSFQEAAAEGGAPPEGFYLYDPPEQVTGKLSRLDWLKREFPKYQALKHLREEIERKLPFAAD